jgi:ribosomal protein S18 acetylase RimI-like enzyme
MTAAIEISQALREIARERGWPEDVARRVARAGVSLSELRMWAWMIPAERVDEQIAFFERLASGDLRGRVATLADNDALSQLFAESPEYIGDWEITTERGPNAFAQFRLQENVQLSVLALGHRLVACCGWSRRNVLVQGRRLCVTYGQALRVHRDFRRQGFGDQVRRLAWAGAGTRPNHTQYDIMRLQNFAVVDWWKKYTPDFFENTPQQEGRVPGIPVSVSLLPARAGEADPAVRSTRRADLPRCVELVNRTHAGLDLFRPYSEEFLEGALDEGFWGPRPEWFESVYGWADHHVLEEGGRVVACAGLWDRGRNQRERWRRRAGGEAERALTDAAVLDFGFEAGAEEAMARLIHALLSRTHALGRGHLLVPLDHQPALADRLAGLGPLPEQRSLRWGLVDPVVERPYTDLRYW